MCRERAGQLSVLPCWPEVNAQAEDYTLAALEAKELRWRRNTVLGTEWGWTRAFTSLLLGELPSPRCASVSDIHIDMYIGRIASVHEKSIPLVLRVPVGGRAEEDGSNGPPNATTLSKTL